MKRVVILAVICLSACSPVGSLTTNTPESMIIPSVTPTTTRTWPPTASPTASATPTPSLVGTDTSSPTREPTATIEWPDLPPLNPDGPYITWLHPVLGNMLINADGSGLGRLDLPTYEFENSGKWVLDHDIIHTYSPNGDWALIHQGGLFDYRAFQDLILSMVHLPDGAIMYEIPILPASVQSDRYGSYENGFEYARRHFYLADWSPDGRYLAYAAYADSGTTDLFVFDTHERKSRRLTNDPAEIDSFYWSPAGDRIYYINGNGFDIYRASFSSYTLNYTQPGNAVNQGIRTLAYDNDRFVVNGFDRDTGVIYTSHWMKGSNAGGPAVVHAIYYFSTSTQKTTIIGSGGISGGVLVDTVNRAVFFYGTSVTEEWPFGWNIWDMGARNESKRPADFSYQTQIVSFDGRVLTAVDGWYLWCGEPALLSGTKYAYLCHNNAEKREVIGITFGGKTEILAEEGEFSISPDRKWFLIEGEDTSLYSRDGKLVRIWRDEEAFNYFWAPSGDGIYYSNNFKELRFYSFTHDDTSVIFTCPFADNCYFPGRWIP